MTVSIANLPAFVRRGPWSTAAVAWMIFGLCVIAVGASSPAQADYQRGVAAYAAGNFDSAYRELQPMAEDGHAGAQLHLGLMYLGGKGVERQPVRGYRLLTCAAFDDGEIGERAAIFRDQVAPALSSSVLQAATSAAPNCDSLKDQSQARSPGASAPRLNRVSFIEKAFYLPGDLFVILLYSVAHAIGADSTAGSISNLVTEFGNGMLIFVTLVFWAIGILSYFHVLSSSKLIGIGAAKRLTSKRSQPNTQKRTGSFSQAIKQQMPLSS